MTGSPAAEADQPTDTQNQRRRAIIDAAARLFSERSYHDATMKDIGAEVGINAATVYYYFRSKEEIFLHIMDTGLDEHLRRFQVVLEREDSPERQLQSLIHTYLDQTVSRPYTNLYNRYAYLLPEDARNRLALRRDEVDRVVEEVIRRCSGDGALTSDLALLRLFLLGAMNSVAYWFRPDGGMTAEQVSERFTGFTLKALEDRHHDPNKGEKHGND